jgi:hypothetical protein
MPNPWFAPKYNTLTFAQIWGSLAEFEADYAEGIQFFYQNTSPIKADSVKTLYFLLYAKYGNSPIANNDVNQFKFKVWSTIYAYGPMWEKKQEIEDAVRNLTEEELLRGSKQIYNHAYNPSSTPSTATLEELTYINDQNTATHKKSKMEAYSILWELLHASETEEFLRQFKKLFSVAVAEQHAPFYIEEEDEL